MLDLVNEFVSEVFLEHLKLFGDLEFKFTVSLGADLCRNGMDTCLVKAHLANELLSELFGQIGLRLRVGSLVLLGLSSRCALSGG